MAPKRPLGNPPPASSSDEEEEDPSEELVSEKQEDEIEEEEEEEESSSEEDEAESPPKATASPLPASPTKPIVHTPVEPKKQTPAPTKKLKRPSQTPTPATPETTKKRKTAAPTPTPSSAGGDETAKKGIFQRIWSEEDEIAILEGMIQYQSEKGTNPVTDLAGFYEFIKDSIHIEPTLDQLLSKIKKIKNKYQNKAKKCTDGEDPVFAKSNDRKTYQLSKTIWGAVESNEKSNNVKKSKNGGVKSNASTKEREEEQSLSEFQVRADGGDEFWSAYPCLKKSIEFMQESLRGCMKDTMGSVEGSQVKELEERWRKINEDEFELYLRRTKLFLDVSQALGYGQGI